MANKEIILPVLFGEKEDLYNLNVSKNEYDQIMNGDQNLLHQIVLKEKERLNVYNKGCSNMNVNEDKEEDVDDPESLESSASCDNNNNEDVYKNTGNFSWPEKAVLLFLELYREREEEFISGMKRHTKLWQEIASEMQKSNYNVSGIQVQNKMSSLKRTYKKTKDANAKSGNNNSCWAYYGIMDSLFGNKGWISPPAVASSEGPTEPTNLSNLRLTSHAISLGSSDGQDISSKPKKRKVETILESFISDLNKTKNDTREEKKIEKLEKEEKKQQRWEERKQMHQDTIEIQKSFISLLSKLVDRHCN